MAPRGRPPKPLEEKRRTGRSPGRDSGGRKLPVPSNVLALPPADGVPEYPADLGVDGRQLWDRAWTQAITWLSVASDADQVEHAARAADDLAVARARYRVTTDPADMRALVAAAKVFQEALSALGFNPVARARLGIAEVKRVSALEELITQRQQRRSSKG